MFGFEQVDLRDLFTLSVPLVELLIRGSAIYWFLFLMLRFVMRRDAASVGMADVLFLVLLADAAQNAMAGSYHSITDGIVLVSVLLGWNFLLDWLAFYFPLAQRFIDPPALELVKNGRLVRRNLRSQHITDEELWAKLREQGVDSLDAVKRVCLESDGKFSVLKRS